MCFNTVKPPIDFWLPEGTRCLSLKRSELNNTLSDTENRKLSKIELCAYWIDIDGKVKYNFIELKIDELCGKHIM